MPTGTGDVATTSDVPAECEAGFLIEEHPNLRNYLTPGNPCVPTGTTGDWNSFTGQSGGWVPVAFDLAPTPGSRSSSSSATSPTRSRAAPG